MYNDTQKTQGGLISVDKHRKKVPKYKCSSGCEGVKNAFRSVKCSLLEWIGETDD